MLYSLVLINRSIVAQFCVALIYENNSFGFDKNFLLREEKHHHKLKDAKKINIT